MTKQEHYELVLDYFIEYCGGYCDIEFLWDECWNDEKYEIVYTMDCNVSYAVIKYKEVK